MKYVSTTSNTPDLLTKILPREAVDRLLALLGIGQLWISTLKWIMWRVFWPRGTRHWAPRNARGASHRLRELSLHKFRFSNKKWTAKSRIFVENRRFPNRQIRNGPQNRKWSPKIVDFQIRIGPPNRKLSPRIVDFQKRMDCKITHFHRKSSIFR